MALATTERTSNNLNLYLETAASHYLPGGGSFSIDNFSLETLYKEHMILRNVWTQTNDNLPLVRYIKCVMYLYRSATSDWLFYYNNQYPMKSDLTMYQSCQPYIMLLNNKTKVIPCKQYNKNKKPYKKSYHKTTNPNAKQMVLSKRYSTSTVITNYGNTMLVRPHVHTS